MAYRYGNREQVSLLPASIQEFVGPDDPVRAYDAFVDALDLTELGLELDESRVGNASYDPAAMLKLLLYGYSYGYRSSRKLERAVHHNLAFIWLMGGLRPDHKTISDFRRRNRAALKSTLRQSARVCLRLGLVDGNTLFVDGTKLRANASLSNAWDAERCAKALESVDQRIEQLITECDQEDAREEADGSLTRLSNDLATEKKLRERVAEILLHLQQTNRSSINTVDPDCIRTRSSRGAHAGYNAQIVVDDRNGLIVNSDVVAESGDSCQFAQQIENAADTLERYPATAVADAGYHNCKELKKVCQKGVSVVVPSPLHNTVNADDRYHRLGFAYDAKSDTFTCPAGHTLRCFGFDESKQRKRYRIENQRVCLRCANYGTCTTSRRGRSIHRHVDEDLVQQLAENYRSNEGIYARRKQRAELPFGHFKANMNISTLLLRGRDGARAEFALIATAFNLTRAMNILSVKGLIAALA